MTDDIELKDVLAAVGEVKNAASERFKLIDTTTQAVKETQVGLQARLLDLEQKAARCGGGGQHTGSGGNIGEQLLDMLQKKSDGLEAMRNGHRGRVSFDLPVDFLQRKSDPLLSPGATMPQQLPDIVGLPQRRLTIRDLLPTIPTTSGAVVYLQQTGLSANAAAVVAEGESKPRSSIKVAGKTAAIVTIAHWMRASVQVLADTPSMLDFLGRTMRYGLAFMEEAQLLRGSGADNNLLGLLTAAAAFNSPIGDATIRTRLDIIRLAITQLQDNGFTPGGIVLYPTDWALIELAKDAEDRYLAGQPRGASMASLWGLPVIPITPGQYLIGDFQQTATLLDRQQSTVEVATQDEDNFTNNLVTIRAEERIGLAMIRPEAMVTGLFPKIPAAI